MNSNAQAVSRLDDLPEFFSAAELSRVLGISKSTAYRHTKMGRLPCLRIGGRIVFSRAHLIRWIDQEITRMK